MYKPEKIIKYVDGYAVVHGDGKHYAYKKTLCEALQLAIEWKNRGFCIATDIDNLFLNDQIEGLNCDNNITLSEFVERLLT